MRRYSNIRYGGFGNDYPAKINTEDTMPAHRLGEPPLLPTPADLLRRKPGTLIEQTSPEDYDIERIARVFARAIERSVVPNYDGLRFPMFQQITFNSVPASGSILLLPKTTSTRVYLLVTGVQGEGGGFQFVAFGRPALITDIAFDASAAGQDKLVWEYTVPQQEVWGLNSAAIRSFTVVFAELDPRSANDIDENSNVRSLR